MSQAPVDAITTRGFQPPLNTQFSVFLENRVGRLLDLVGVFEGQALRVAAFSVIDAADHAVVRVLTSRGELARRLLERNHMTFAETDLLVVELDELHGRGLANLCSVLLSAEINICFAYPLLVRPHGAPAIALHTDDLTLAGYVLRRKLYVLLGENDLGENATGSPPSGPITQN